jgi:hypothetical protein
MVSNERADGSDEGPENETQQGNPQRATPGSLTCHLASASHSDSKFADSGDRQHCQLTLCTEDRVYVSASAASKSCLAFGGGQERRHVPKPYSGSQTIIILHQQHSSGSPETGHEVKIIKPRTIVVQPCNERKLAALGLARVNEPFERLSFSLRRATQMNAHDRPISQS